ncbi:unnamed protein product [Heterobilharzia americana]|nr:unnamed protein product [Heterobilharzia americana]
MHSCLTLVDYTWKDSEESGTSTPRYPNRDHINHLRRTARSLDGDSTNCLLNNQDDGTAPLPSSSSPPTTTTESNRKFRDIYTTS